MKSIVFEAHEDKIDGGFVALALGYGIRIQGRTVQELRGSIPAVVDCCFEENEGSPKVDQLGLAREEVIVR